VESARHMYTTIHLWLGQAADGQCPSVHQSECSGCFTATEVTIDRDDKTC